MPRRGSATDYRDPDATGTVTGRRQTRCRPSTDLAWQLTWSEPNLTATATGCRVRRGRLTKPWRWSPVVAHQDLLRLRNEEVTVTLRSIPPQSGVRYLGALVLVRDVTDLRRRRRRC